MNIGEARLAEILGIYDVNPSSVECIVNRLNQDGWTVYRKKVIVNRRRPVSSVAMTPRKIKQIKTLHKTTNMNQQQIANEVGTNIGRVNEVLHGAKLASSGT